MQSIIVVGIYKASKVLLYIVDVDTDDTIDGYENVIAISLAVKKHFNFDKLKNSAKTVFINKLAKAYEDYSVYKDVIKFKKVFEDFYKISISEPLKID